MNPRPVKAIPHPDHSLTLTFDNGEVKRFDLAPYLGYPAFEPLRNIGFFQLARCQDGNLEWPGNLDFDPDRLYLESQPVPQSEAA
jgi:hypothetical protein